MKSLQVMPTEENLINTYKLDVINRNKDVNSFVNILNDVDGQMSICIDGQWGSGKTFFVKQTKLVLDAMNDVCTNLSDETKKIIKNTFAIGQNNDEDKTYKSQFTVYYDAWENDNDCDPLLSIIYEVTKAASCNGPVTDNVNLVDIAVSIVDMVGINIEKLFEKIKPSNITSNIQKQRTIYEAVTNFLDTVIEERGDRLVIFIDELDRCKPSFAVSLLERIKHYFYNKKVTFVFSINSIELTKTIRKFYGSDFNAQNYLDRFFDFSVKLPDIDMTKYYEYIGQYIDMYGNAMDSTIHFVINYLNLEMRTVSNYLNMIEISGIKKLYEKYKTNTYFDDGFSDGKYFCLGFIAPIMIGLYLFDRQQYNEFISGQNSKLLLAALKDVNNAGDYYFSKLLNSDESYSNEPQKKQVTEKEKVAEICKLIFKDDNPHSGYKIIGSLRFYDDVKSWIFNITSILR